MTARSILVFAGPSLPTVVRPDDPAFNWRPPAAAGDFLQLLADPPDTVCLIDGYFDARPAVWHKEILLLIEAGTCVLGAASMGALRAAELDRHGMIGVGVIYDFYRCGRLHGDDEVALIHARQDLGWQPVSEPMIEVRATLAAALRARIIPMAIARRLRATAIGIHFSDRDWPAILKQAGCDHEQLSKWLRTGVVRLKQRDALLCIAAAKERRAPVAGVQPVPRTCFVASLAANIGAEDAFRRSRRVPADREPAP